MNKDLFLMQLEHLLDDIPKEEREEAMDYYQSYFEDAGEENVTAVLEELESPQKIAESIKEALNSAGGMAGALKNPPQVREYQAQPEYGHPENGNAADAGQSAQGAGAPHLFFGDGFCKDTGQASADVDGSGQAQDAGYGSGQAQDAGYGSGQAQSSSYGNGQAQGTSYGSGQAQSSSYGSGQAQGTSYGSASGGASYRRYDQYEKKGTGFGDSDRRTKLILFVIVAVFTVPIWGAALSGVLGIAGVLIAAVIVLGICSIGGAIAGIVCTIVAVVRICTLSLAKGLFMLGIGMFLIAGSGVCAAILLLLCGKFLPWVSRQLRHLFRRLMHGERSAA